MIVLILLNKMRFRNGEYNPCEQFLRFNHLYVAQTYSMIWNTFTFLWLITLSFFWNLNFFWNNPLNFSLVSTACFCKVFKQINPEHQENSLDRLICFVYRNPFFLVCGHYIEIFLNGCRFSTWFALVNSNHPFIA